MPTHLMADPTCVQNIQALFTLISSDSSIPMFLLFLGGIEASLRRLTHYDYWKDCVRKSILCDAHADMIIYGMGEKQVVSIAQELEMVLTLKI